MPEMTTAPRFTSAQLPSVISLGYLPGPPNQAGQIALADLIELISAGLTQYILPAFFTTTPTAGEVLMIHVAGASFTIPADFAGALQSYVGTNPTATFDLTVKQNGTTIGTISVATSGAVTATTDGGTAKAIAAGDRLTIEAPASADATAANMAFTIIGVR